MGCVLFFAGLDVLLAEGYRPGQFHQLAHWLVVFEQLLPEERIQLGL
jgi:hypothetical protein